MPKFASRFGCPALSVLFLAAAALGMIACGGNQPVTQTSDTGGNRTSPPQLVSITVTPAAPSTMVGSTQQLTATGSYSDHSSKDITSSVQWTSATATVASVSSSGLTAALSVGTSIITATVGSINGSTTLTVTVPALVSISVTPTAASLPLGLTQQFTATGSYSDRSTEDITSSVQWTSATTTVASVSSSGLATALAVGTSIIAAAVGSISGSATLTVTAPALVSIAITPEAVSLPLASTQQFTAIGTYTDKSTADLTDQIDWNTTRPQVAAISAAGLASPSQIGFTKVTATIDGISGTANLAVVGVPRYLYDLSDAGRDISRLTINASSGQPRYLGYQLTNEYDNIGFGCLSIDPSGKYAYVTSQVQDATTGADVDHVLAYSINAATGALTLLPGSPYTLTETIGCLQFLPGGNFAYATPAIGGVPNDLVTLAKDASGNLSVVNSITLPNSPAGLAVDPQGKFLYLTSEEITPGGTAYAYGYTIDSTTGGLTLIDGMPLQLPNNTAGQFSFNPSGDFLYMADGNGTAIKYFSVNRNSGVLTADADVVNPCVNPRTVRFSPDGQFAFTSCGTGGVVSFSVDHAGQLTPISTAPTKPPRKASPSIRRANSSIFYPIPNISRHTRSTRMAH